MNKSNEIIIDVAMVSTDTDPVKNGHSVDFDDDMWQLPHKSFFEYARDFIFPPELQNKRDNRASFIHDYAKMRAANSTLTNV